MGIILYCIFGLLCRSDKPVEQPDQNKTGVRSVFSTDHIGDQNPFNFDQLQVLEIGQNQLSLNFSVNHNSPIIVFYSEERVFIINQPVQFSSKAEVERMIKLALEKLQTTKDKLNVVVFGNEFSEPSSLQKDLSSEERRAVLEAFNAALNETWKILALSLSEFLDSDRVIFRVFIKESYSLVKLEFKRNHLNSHVQQFLPGVDGENFEGQAQIPTPFGFRYPIRVGTLEDSYGKKINDFSDNPNKKCIRSVAVRKKIEY